MGKSKAAKVQVPECRYGAACSRKDCVFRHPPKQAKPTVAAADKSDKVCFSYVAGRCAFGKFCHDRHPDEASCRTIRDRYAKIDCQWGRTCRTEGCLYRHPSDEPIGPSMPIERPKPQPAVFAGANNPDPANAPVPRPQVARPQSGRPQAVSQERARQEPPPEAAPPPVHVEDEGLARTSPPLHAGQGLNEELAQQEQLAATLRLMGFDDEGLRTSAVLHSGGDLNVAADYCFAQQR
mmetsp:Transcript_62324/g.136159  ORF Transcript_62324/g.136159 Transcript_62324/m.136159 type:complete len:237 (-) Transcript_62324:48-758(-)